MARAKTADVQAEAPASADLVFEFEPIEEMAKGPARRTRQPSQFDEPIRLSWENRDPETQLGQPLQVTVPDAQVDAVRRAISNAARYQELGANTRVVDNGDGTSRVQFQARVKRERAAL